MALLIIPCILGVTLAIVAALSIWLALGKWTFMWRAILAIVGASGVALAFCAASGELEAEWLGLAWVVVVTVTAMFLIVRQLGFKLVDTTTGDRSRSDEMQFSLTQLVVLTAGVGAIAAVARVLAPLVATANALTLGLTIAFCLGTLALVAVWATLGPVATRLKLSTFAIVAVQLAGLVYYWMEVTNADPGLVWGGVVIVYSIALAGSLLIARSYGLRLQYCRSLHSQRGG